MKRNPLGCTKTAYLLAKIIDDRMNGFDIMDPAFTTAIDRMADGSPDGLSNLIRRCSTSHPQISYFPLIELVLEVWSESDCQVVFGVSRKDITKMIG